jgi:accessory colonization factor AcfC
MMYVAQNVKKIYHNSGEVSKNCTPELNTWVWITWTHNNLLSNIEVEEVTAVSVLKETHRKQVLLLKDR